MKHPVQFVALILIASSAVGGPLLARACTGITVKPKDGSVVFGRTLEFGMDMRSNVIVVPRGHAYVGTAPGDQQGLRWQVKYGFVGANAFDMPVTLDGVNERGLHVGLFYFPGYAKYQEVPATDVGQSMAPWELGAFLLSVCASTPEAIAAAKEVRIGAVVQKDMGIVPPAHYIVTDAQGASAVIEYIGGELRVHDNPLGVCTNSPSFDWHMTNLSNYVNESAMNVPPVDVRGVKIRGLGQGSGMLGLPGDFTPPSRFVRAAAFSASALPAETARDGVLQTFHILNQFDIPRGAARSVENGQTSVDYTLWTAVSDLTHRRFYFRTFANSRIRMVDLKQLNFDAPSILTISMSGDEEIEDVTADAK